MFWETVYSDTGYCAIKTKVHIKYKHLRKHRFRAGSVKLPGGLIADEPEFSAGIADCVGLAAFADCIGLVLGLGVPLGFDAAL